MVAPVGFKEQELMRFEVNGDGSSVKEEKIMNVWCQEMETEMCQREVEKNRLRKE